MHFLILTQYFPPETGAPQVRLAAMIRELLRLGHTVEVVTALPNYPEGQIEILNSVNNPEDENTESREVSFSRELYIERSDFMIDPPKKFFRLGPGLSTRLKDAYKVTCDDYKINAESGEV